MDVFIDSFLYSSMGRFDEVDSVKKMPNKGG